MCRYIKINSLIHSDGYEFMKNKFGKLTLLFAFGILLSAIWSNVAAYAQNKTTTSVAASAAAPKPEQHITKIKITSPTRGQQVPVGKDLTISGTSIDNTTASTNDCKVSVVVNKVRPYQPATSATGTDGGAAANDYSKWNFVLTSKYTTIKPGQNRITAKYGCGNNAALTAFSSVNVTGVQAATATTAAAATTAPATTTTASAAAAKQQLQQYHAATNSTSPASASNSAAVQQKVAPVSNISNKSLLSSTSTIAPQVKAAPQENTINQQQEQQQPQQLVKVSNGTAGQNSMLAPPPALVASDKLMYLGYHGNKSDTDLTGKNTMSTKSARNYDGSSATDNGSADNGSVDTKSSRHISTDTDLTGKNTMSTKSARNYGDIYKDSNTSTSQININRNNDNGNNNFIFPFSYP
jgi:hypothetical protein